MPSIVTNSQFSKNRGSQGLLHQVKNWEGRVPSGLYISCAYVECICACRLMSKIVVPWPAVAETDEPIDGASRKQTNGMN